MRVLNSLHHSPESTSATTHSANVTDLAHRAAVLGEVLRAVERTRDGGFAARIDGRVAGTADGELGEGVEFDVDGVRGLALGDGLEFAGLGGGLVLTLEWRWRSGRVNLQYP
jgi:hypothetical protein